MKVEVKEIRELVRELSIEIPAETVNGELEKAFSERQRDAVIKGYRKGKAPMSLVKSHFDDDVKADVADKLFRASYPKIVDENQLKVASLPTVTKLRYDEDGTLRYTATVDVMPELGRIDLGNLAITTFDIEVTDQEVNALSESMRDIFADLRPVDREVQSNDLVTVDLKKLYDPGLVLKKDQLTDVEIDLSRPFTLKDFKQHLPGMKAGDRREIDVVYENDYSDPALSGARVKYLCTVKSVSEKILPEFDDALAKRTGRAETALELRLKLREDLKLQHAADLRRINKGEIIQLMCKQNPIPVPDSMVNEYLDALVEEQKEQYPGGDEAEVRSRGREVAENTLRWNFLYHHLADQERIEVSTADTEQFIKNIAEDYKVTYDKARDYFERTGRLDRIRDSLLEAKVLDYLIGKARVVPLSKTDLKE
ncbi:MAG TPA: trigger factor [Candidatus Deferrimicrobium sp.]|nr:trigger factor [Candidatus Deferrimicrobium sp.]